MIPVLFGAYTSDTRLDRYVRGSIDTDSSTVFSLLMYAPAVCVQLICCWKLPVANGRA